MALAQTFIQTDGTRFMLDGRAFPVVGVNCYFLTYCSVAARQDALAAIQRLRANVIRSVGFLNLKERPASGPYFQFQEGGKILINEGPDGLGRLDALVAAAEEADMRLILPLVNYWDDLGGMRTYLDWLFPGENLEVEEFFRRPEARAAFKNWAGHIVDRYRDSPAIFAWELANEPRCPGFGGRELLLDWIQDMAAFIKSRDPNHLVGVGDEGFLRHDEAPNHLYTGEYGVDFEATLGIPEIDFGTFHFYPAKEQMNVPLRFGSTWITDHIESGERANKPVLLEEYGIQIGDYGVQSGLERDAWYVQWLGTVYEKNGAGDLLWMVGSREPSVAGNADSYTVYSTAEVPSLQDHIDKMRSRAGFK